MKKKNREDKDEKKSKIICKTQEKKSKWFGRERKEDERNKKKKWKTRKAKKQSNESKMKVTGWQQKRKGTQKEPKRT